MRTEKREYFAIGEVVNGYFGDYMPVSFYFKDGKTYLVNEEKFVHCPAVIPPCVDTKEALWMLQNHSTWKRYYRNIKDLEQN